MERQLPGEVDRILDAGVHAVTAGGAVRVGGVACGGGGREPSWATVRPRASVAGQGRLRWLAEAAARNG